MNSAAGIIALVLLIVTGTFAKAQSDFGACPVLVRQSYEFTENVCGIVTDGQACVGSGQVSATPVTGASLQFEIPGDRANLADIQRFQTRTMTADSRSWTTVTAQLETATEDGAQATVNLLALGDVVMWQAGESASVDSEGSETRQATVLAERGALARQDASPYAKVVWQLSDGSTVEAFGRSADGQWIRILLPSPNGGAGWVFGHLIAVDGGAELLPIQTNATPLASSTAIASVPAYRMESFPASAGCPEAPESGILLQSSRDARALFAINDVELSFAGTVFLTAQIGGDMRVYNLEGETSLLANGLRSAVPEDMVSSVPMDNSLRPVANPGQPQAFAAEFVSRLRYLPFQSLPREIAAAEETAVVLSASAAAMCPSSVQETYNKTAMYCGDLNRNQVCLGNVGAGMIDVAPRLEGASFGFALPGDITGIHNIERLSMTVADDPERTWSTLVLRMDTNTSDGGIASAAMIVIGDVDLVNHSDAMSPLPEDRMTNGSGMILGSPAQVQVSQALGILAQPRVDSDTVALADDGSEVMALATSVDRLWIQVQTENGIRGWAAARFLAVEGGVETLPVVGDTSDETGRMPETDTSADMEAARDDLIPAFEFLSLDAFPSCGHVPPGGILVQSPSESNVMLAINGADLAINGTVYLTANRETLSVYGLERATFLEIDGIESSIFAGEQATIPMIMGQVAEAALVTVKLYDARDGIRLRALPTHLLPRVIDVPLPDPENVRATDEAEPTTSNMQPPKARAEVAQDQCVISAGGMARNIRQGPGTDYAIVDVLRLGQAMIGKTQKRGTYGLYWYNTDRGWIRFDAGEMTSACGRLPIHAAEIAPAGSAPPPLYNEILGDVCAAGGANLSATIRGSGSRYHEFAGLWTGQAGASATFRAETSYFHESFANVITLSNDDGSLWLGSSANNDIAIQFAEARDFRVRVSGLLGDHVTLQVSC
ncbi:MAG: SH3 domain-containing protein [Chloroflexi bacterium]|nr:SH3 domain-containing protein [Chloroflexota bacterium]